jgi:hypothetical protein
VIIPRPERGMVIRYNFLWRREADEGREEAAKSRPCAIVTAVEIAGDHTIVTVTPITHSPPAANELALEIPAEIKQALGLDSAPSWIVTGELNSFVWPGPDIETLGPGSHQIVYGRLPKSLFVEMVRNVLKNARLGRARIVKRTE